MSKTEKQTLERLLTAPDTSAQQQLSASLVFHYLVFLSEIMSIAMKLASICANQSNERPQIHKRAQELDKHRLTIISHSLT